MGKRAAESVEKANVVHVLDLPKKRPRPQAQNHYATSDAIVLELSTHTVLQNAMLWEYATHASASYRYGREVLEAALTPLEDLNYNTTGEARKQSVPNMIRSFWKLHSKFIAPNGTQVRGMYNDVIEHVLSLYVQYGDEFMASGSKQEQAFVRVLAEESVPPDESEKVAENGILERLQNELKQSGFTILLDNWFSEWGDIPKGGEPVDMRRNESVYFRSNGVLALSIRLIAEFIERLRHPDNAPKENSANLREFVDWQMEYQGKFEYFPSCILLGVPCVIQHQNFTQLEPSFWENTGIQLILKQLSKERNHPAADTISALFIYSGIDPSNGIDAMLELMSSALQGHDKATGEDLDKAYDRVLTEHTQMRGPPWRTKNTAWPDGAVMENSNYTYAKLLIDMAAIPTKAIVTGSMPIGGEKRAATVLETQQLVPPTGKKQKVAATPQDEVVVEVGEGTNLPLIGGILAITAGIGAVYMSRRRK